MLHLVAPPVGRTAGRLSAAHRRLGRWIGTVDPDVRRLGVDSRRTLGLILGIVVLVSSIAIPSTLAARGALDAVVRTLEGGEVTDVRMATTVRSAPVAATAPDLQVHVQLPTSLPAGSSRQFRVAVSGDATAGTPGVRDGTDDLLHVAVELPQSDLTVGLIQITPDMATVTRHDLLHVVFRVEVDASLRCDADLGDVLVRVSDDGSGETLGETRVALPPIDCREAPPRIAGR